MLIRSNLFSRGHPLKAEPGLSDLLEGHKRSVLNRIKGVSDLSQLTDSFCEGLIKNALVEPLVLHFDRMTRQTRTEQIDGSLFPFDFYVERGRSYPKTVVRISVPFTGDPKLLEYSPSSAGLTFPRGEVNGEAVQFDILMWGYPDDASRAKNELDSNRGLLETCATNVTKQVKEFNETLAPQIKDAFVAKLEELTKQHAVFDDLGIPEETEAAPPSTPVVAKPKRGKARAVQIILNVQTMIVDTLNQFNKDIENVNNAIQSN